MKKTLSLLTLIALCLSLLFSATSCLSLHPIDRFWAKIEKAESYQLKMNFNIPQYGAVSAKIKVDGNVMYIPEGLLGEEMYIETDDDVTYVYTKSSSGRWVKTRQKNTSSSSADFDYDFIYQLFDSSNFKKVSGTKNTYEMTADALEDFEIDDFDDFDEVILTLEDDSCTVAATVTTQGISFDIELEFSRIGSVEIELPKVK